MELLTPREFSSEIVFLNKVLLLSSRFCWVILRTNLFRSFLYFYNPLISYEGKDRSVSNAFKVLCTEGNVIWQFLSEKGKSFYENEPTNVCWGNVIHQVTALNATLLAEEILLNRITFSFSFYFSPLIKYFREKVIRKMQGFLLQKFHPSLGEIWSFSNNPKNFPKIEGRLISCF